MEVAQDILDVINEAGGDEDEFIFTAARMGLAQANRFTTTKNKSNLTQLYAIQVNHHLRIQKRTD